MNWRYLLLAISGGACLALSQAPFGIWPLVFLGVGFSLQILDLVNLESKAKKGALFALAWMVYAGLMCTWISYFGIVAFLVFLIAQGVLGFAFALFVLNYVPLNQPLLLAASWVGFEWVLANLGPFGFTWLTLSTSMIDAGPIALLARVGGGALLTFLIVVISWIIKEFIKAKGRPLINLNKKLILNAVLFFVIFLTLVAGSLMDFEKDIETKKIVIVQGNDKNRYLTNEELRNDYLTNSHLELSKEITEDSDVIIFPESALDSDPEKDPKLKSQLAEVAKKADDLLIVNAIANDDNGRFNRNYFYSHEMQLLGQYDKQRLVPFGEHVLFEDLIGSWSVFDAIGDGFDEGTEAAQSVRGVTSVICYESAFSSDVRNALDDQAQLLVVSTNNRSYRRSGNSIQHQRQSRLRAIEYGIPVVHASVSGSSAIISSRGDVISRSHLFEKTLISGQVTTSKPDSFYAKTRDWLSLISLLVVGYLALAKTRKRAWKNQTSTK